MGEDSECDASRALPRSQPESTLDEDGAAAGLSVPVPFPIPRRLVLLEDGIEGGEVIPRAAGPPAVNCQSDGCRARIEWEFLDAPTPPRRLPADRQASADTSRRPHS
jgi:hypothetical protein